MERICECIIKHCYSLGPEAAAAARAPAQQGRGARGPARARRPRRPVPVQRPAARHHPQPRVRGRRPPWRTQGQGRLGRGEWRTSMKIGVLMFKCVIVREMTEATAADLRHAGITSTEAGARREEAEMEASEAAPSSPTGTGTRPTMTTFDLCFLYIRIVFIRVTLSKLQNEMCYHCT